MEHDLLRATRVVDLSAGIAGAYASLLLAGAGADVVKVEPPAGDPLRSWVASGSPLGAADGALFRFLNASKRSLTGSPRDVEVRRLLAGADLLLEGGELSNEDLRQVRESFPGLAVVSLTPFGRVGPWVERPCTEFILQALCGSIWSRGTPDRPPLQVGGRMGEWIAGAYAAFASLAALRATRASGRGEHADVSIFECMCLSMSSGSPLEASLRGAPSAAPARTVELPSVEPTADGYVGFCTVTAQQFRDFLVLIERPDLIDDAGLASFSTRHQRRADFLPVVHAWTTRHSTAEIVERASLFRIPATPVGQPESLLALDHLREREVYSRSPCGGFVRPCLPFRVDGERATTSRPAPGLGEHAGRIGWEPRPVREPARAGVRPLEGVRVVDLTTFWAGPLASAALGMLGAEVIKVESIQRPDAFRFVFAKPPSEDHWWETGSGFHLANVNKRGLTLDLGSARGRELLLDLIACSDAVIENFSPRVIDNFGITWEEVRRMNPRAVMVRMPAFGLTGPWRDRTGFAQTIEQASGLAWVTGYADGPPVTPRGPCDPTAGMHAAFALLAALEDRDRTGRGHFVECPMIETALNVAAEITLERSAYGAVLMREGNRGPGAAPQGLYACRGEERWLAISVTSDDQWQALRAALGDPDWARARELQHHEGRRRAHDAVDAKLAAWAAERDLDEAAEQLCKHGVPAGPVSAGPHLLDNPQLQARGFYETIETPLIGRHPNAGLPFRFAANAEPWIRSAAPTLGQHNREILVGLLGLADDDVTRLERDGVIGQRPRGL